MNLSNMLRHISIYMTVKGSNVNLRITYDKSDFSAVNFNLIILRIFKSAKMWSAWLFYCNCKSELFLVFIFGNKLTWYGFKFVKLNKFIYSYKITLNIHFVLMWCEILNEIFFVKIINADGCRSLIWDNLIYIFSQLMRS